MAMNNALATKSSYRKQPPHLSKKENNHHISLIGCIVCFGKDFDGQSRLELSQSWTNNH